MLPAQLFTSSTKQRAISNVFELWWRIETGVTLFRVCWDCDLDLLAPWYFCPALQHDSELCQAVTPTPVVDNEANAGQIVK